MCKTEALSFSFWIVEGVARGVKLWAPGHIACKNPWMFNSRYMHFSLSDVDSVRLSSKYIRSRAHLPCYGEQNLPP